jgi:undecaprenyl-diphosphatase
VAPTVVDGGEVALALFTLAALGYLLWRRAFGEAAVIVAGLLLCLLSAHALKSMIARPRPVDEIVTAGGFSFPSTTSALGISITAIAIALSRLAPIRKRRPVILAGLTASFLLGLAFVALRVHYMSDVIAGWALGVLVFSLCDLVSLSLALWLCSGGA